jgi:hypothetical protein
VLHFCSFRHDPSGTALIRPIMEKGLPGTVAQRPKYALELRIDRPGVHSGTISVPDLLRICQTAQGTFWGQTN